MTETGGALVAHSALHIQSGTAVTYLTASVSRCLACLDKNVITRLRTDQG